MNKYNKARSFRHVITATFAVVLLVKLLALSAQAAGKTIEISDLGIQCAIPDYFSYILTRDNIKSDADVSSFGMTKDQILNLFKENNIYLDAFTEDFGTDLIISMAPNSTTGDFSEYGDSILNSLGNAVVENLKTVGYSNIVCEVYHHTDTLFLKFEYSMPSGSDYSYSIQYYTVMNSQEISFTISFMTKPTASEKTIIKGVVDSAVFKNAPVKESESEINKKHPAFDYNDEYISIHIPMGWSQEPTSSYHEPIKAKFKKVSLPGIIMAYSFQDIWEQLSADEKQGHSRSEMSFSSMTDQEIRDMLGTTLEELGADIGNISFETVGGKKYCQLVMTVYENIDGMKLGVKSTQMVYLANGYAFSFVFYREPTGKQYEEFKAILESVTYHLFDEGDNNIIEEISTTPTQSFPSETQHAHIPNSDSPAHMDYMGFIGVGVGVVVLIIAVIILTRKKTSQKQNKVEISSHTYNDSLTLHTDPKGDSTYQIKFCHKCGSRLSEEDTQCKNCGAIIPR